MIDEIDLSSNQVQCVSCIVVFSLHYFFLFQSSKIQDRDRVKSLSRIPFQPLSLKGRKDERNFANSCWKSLVNWISVCRYHAFPRDEYVPRDVGRTRAEKQIFVGRSWVEWRLVMDPISP